MTGPREQAREIVEKWYREHPRLMIPPFERAELAWAIAAALDEAQRGAGRTIRLREQSPWETAAQAQADPAKFVSMGAPTGAESGEAQGDAPLGEYPRDARVTREEH